MSKRKSDKLMWLVTELRASGLTACLVGETVLAINASTGNKSTYTVDDCISGSLGIVRTERGCAA